FRRYRRSHAVLSHLAGERAGRRARAGLRRSSSLLAKRNRRACPGRKEGKVDASNDGKGFRAPLRWRRTSRLCARYRAVRGFAKIRRYRKTEEVLVGATGQGAREQV